MSIDYIVTGAAGFIGRNVVQELNTRGFENILLVDRLGDTDKWKNLVGLRYDDFLDKDDFRRSLTRRRCRDLKAVFHLGACSATTERDADYLLDNNYRYTRDVCEWCLTEEVKFVYASSAATYGDGTLGYGDDDAKTPMYEPLNMYGYSKHMFDLWALQQGLFDKISGLKYFNVYGPFEDHKDDMRSVVNKAYGQIMDTGEVTLFKSHKPDYADGEQKRDFIYVKDAVDVTLWLGEEGSPSGLFNCGTGEARTWIDLVSATFAALGKEPTIRFADMPKHLQGKYQYFTEAEMGKLRSAGYKRPFYTLEDGINDYVQNYLVL